MNGAKAHLFIRMCFCVFYRFKSGKSISFMFLQKFVRNKFQYPEADKWFVVKNSPFTDICLNGTNFLIFFIIATQKRNLHKLNVTIQ